MKKFLLINSPIYREAIEDDEQYLPPIGLAYIATYLEKEGIDVELIDAVRGRKSVRGLTRDINVKRPECVGINVFTQNLDLVREIVEGIECGPEIFVGGQVVKHIQDEILDWNTENSLHLIIGEGELIIPKLVVGECGQSPSWARHNRDAYVVDSDSRYYPSNISSLELDRSYLGDELLINHYGQREAAIITSRGCPFDCAFCGGARSLNKGTSIRWKTRDSIMGEIDKVLLKHPEVSSIRILDDLFLRNKRSIIEAVEIFSGYDGLSWRGMAHVASVNRSFSRIPALAASGCTELFIGIESGSDDMRKQINKVGSVEDVLEASKMILDNGIDLKGYFIFGFPGETEDDFRKTFELALRIKEASMTAEGDFRTSAFQFRPYHGTRIYNEIIENGGCIKSIKQSGSLGNIEGRKQFSFDSGNYSAESDEVLKRYIVNTQKLAE